MKNLTNFYKGKKVLITGGTGYIGNLLATKLKEYQSDVIIFTSSAEKMCPASKIYYVDYLKPESYGFLLTNIDIIFHLAGQTSAYEAEDKPLFNINSSISPIVNIVMLLKKLKIKPSIVLASTATVYGLQNFTTFDESAKTMPSTIYDLNKLICEQYIQIFSQKGYINGCSLRLSNVYGPSPAEGASDRGIINKMIKLSLSGQDLVTYGDGQYIRDYIYNKDVVMAFMLAAAFTANQAGEPFNISTGIGHNFCEVISLIINITKQSKIKYLNFPKLSLEIEKRNFIGEYTKFYKATGWIPQYNLRDGIISTIKNIK